MGRKLYPLIFLIYLLASLGVVFGVFQSLEGWGINHRYFMRYVLDSSTIQNSPIVVVGIDGKSLRQLGSWPWSRETHQKLLTELKAAGAIEIGLDIIFDQPREPETDLALAKSLQENQVVLPLTLDLSIYRGFLGETIQVESVHEPVSIFKNVTRTGHINIIPEEDGVVRRSFPILDEIPSFDLRLAHLYNPELTMRKKAFGINYQRAEKVYAYYSYGDVLNKNYPQDAFQDKIVLIGAIDPALGDQFVTPLSHLGLMTGIEIHAHRLYTLLTESFVSTLSPVMSILLLTILSIISGYIVRSWKPSSQILAILALSFGYYICSHYIFINYYFIIPYIPVAVILLGNLFIGILSSYLSTNLEREQLYQTFHRYLAPQVLEQVLQNTEEVKLGGVKKEIAVLFVDIRGFTKYSDTHQPEQVVELLNNYLYLFAEIIFEYEGTLDKYLGDGLMAVFGAPIASKDDLIRANQAAQKIIQEVRKQDLPLPVGIGLAYGLAISGNIGSDRRLEYTVIGDTVNKAARLEGLAGPGEIIFSKEAAVGLELQDEMNREQVQIKGFMEELTIYRMREER